MKPILTDRFLWMVYNFYEATEKALEPPEIFRLKTFKEMLRPHPEFWRNLERKRRKRQFAQFVNYLKRKGYIKVAVRGGKKGILLTPRGKQKALKVEFIQEKSSLKQRKDRKWVMVIFDIPEKKRRYRDDFRKFLYSLKFKKLQKSVWVCPYDVLENLKEIIRTYHLDSFIQTFLIEEIEI